MCCMLALTFTSCDIFSDLLSPERETSLAKGNSALALSPPPTTPRDFDCLLYEGFVILPWVMLLIGVVRELSKAHRFTCWGMEWCEWVKDSESLLALLDR